ncbi:MAG: hypothetical protein CFE24_01950 [Flavobacterium sp. BFFFF2]|nr:MAG: hypothetical protein CFE24_01950 [Flavobacterium sp. BFFFF2]
MGKNNRNFSGLIFILLKINDFCKIGGVNYNLTKDTQHSRQICNQYKLCVFLKIHIPILGIFFENSSHFFNNKAVYIDETIII